ncbi:MAG: FkbM family methyltransferase [Lewinellaceae bacterium]|nr:FkbM family methyltransferase [Lewinellaceae bacterium]
MKAAIKRFLKSLPIAFTQNQRYDRQTQRVVQKVCKPQSNCIDVGCHKGEILDLFLKNAPQGTHFGFEPIPDLYRGLVEKYADKTNCRLFDIALSDKTGASSFNYVVSNPSYSGLLKRDYDHPNEQDTQITVKTERLDELLPPDVHIDLVKIDVEGGELLVLRGAVQTLTRCKPVVIFEHGLGASELYGATPEQVYDLLAQCGLRVSLMDRFLHEGAPMSRETFCAHYYGKKNYYFIAY